MSTTFKFFADGSLVVPLTSATLRPPTSGAAVERRIWFGSPVVGDTLQAASAPGVDPITLSVIDVAAGSGISTAAVRLALSAAELDAAVPGASLELPATIHGGVAGAITIFLRVTNDGQPGGSYPDLRLRINGVQ